VSKYPMKLHVVFVLLQMHHRTVVWKKTGCWNLQER